MKLTPWLNFINILHTAFTLIVPECANKTVKSAVSFGAFGTYERKSCTYNVDEIEPLSRFYVQAFAYFRHNFLYPLPKRSYFHLCKKPSLVGQRYISVFNNGWVATFVGVENITFESQYIDLRSFLGDKKFYFAPISGHLQMFRTTDL